MVAWTNTQIPEHNIHNFTTDWNSGLALCALVEHIKPGSCPDYSNLNPQNGLANCELGIRLAEEHFAIPRILEAAALSNPDVDELSVMTYISYLCKPANEKLMRWLKTLLPDCNITNLTTDWNSGINLACLIDTVSPGCFPNWSQLKASDAVQNLSKAIDIADKQLQVDQFIKAAQMADPSVDELNQVIMLLRLQMVYKPIPKTIICNGPGLIKAFIGCATNFQVEGGKLPEEPKIYAAIGGKKMSLPVSIMKLHDGIFQVTYTPTVVGKLSIDIKWEGAVEHHYDVEIIDLGSFEVKSKYFMPGQLAKIDRPVIMEVNGLENRGDLSVTIQHCNAKIEMGKVISTAAGTAEVNYTPVEVGIDEIIVQLMGCTVPGSPFKVLVADPSKYSVSATTKSLIVMKETTCTIIGGDSQALKASAKSQNHIQDLLVLPLSKETSITKYIPTEVGQHTIYVMCNDEHIKGSPLNLSASDPSKCILMDALPKYLQLGTAASIKIGTKGAGPGELECTSSSTPVATATITKSDQDHYVLKVIAFAMGETSLHLTWAGGEILPGPGFTVYVCDATQCSAYSYELTSGVGKTGVPFDFTVRTTQAGPGELMVKVQGPKAVCTAKVTKTNVDIYEVSFVTSEIGQHLIDVNWGDASIPNSPYTINVIEGVDASQFTLTADNTCIALQPVNCVLFGPVGDLVKNGLLQVKLRGQGFDSKLVGPLEFKPVATEAQVSITETKKGTYEIQYFAPRPGQFLLSTRIDGIDIPGSPFHIKALPLSDASSCVCYGSVLENRLACLLGKTMEFNIDLTKAGRGTLAAKAVNCNCKISITKQEGKIYLVRLEPRESGIHTIEVLWGGAPIPGNPFVFTVTDPSSIVISDLPSKEYVAKVGTPFAFVSIWEVWTHHY